MLFLILFRGWYHYQIFTQYDEQSLSPPSNTPIFQESPSWTCPPPPPPASCPGPATRPGLQWPYKCCLSDTRIFNFWSSTQIQAKSDQDRYDIMLHLALVPSLPHLSNFQVLKSLTCLVSMTKTTPSPLVSTSVQSGWSQGWTWARSSGVRRGCRGNKS